MKREQTCTARALHALPGHYMHCQGIACTRLFGISLTSAVGQKLECFKSTTNNVFINTMNI